MNPPSTKKIRPRTVKSCSQLKISEGSRLRGVRDAFRGQVFLRGCGQYDGVRVAQELRREERAHGDAAHEEEVPGLLLPVVLEELDVTRNAGGAEVAQRTADAEGLVANEQQVGHGEADERTRPRTRTRVV